MALAPPDSARARTLWLRGLDQMSVLAFDSAIVSFKGATIADPTFLPAFLDHLSVLRIRGRSLDFQRDVAARIDVPASTRRCVVELARMTDVDKTAWVPVMSALRAEFGPNPCISFGLAKAMTKVPLTQQRPRAEEVEDARRAARAFPQHHEIIGLLVAALERRGEYVSAYAAATRGAATVPHVLHRQRLRQLQIREALKHADTASALMVLRLLEHEANADRRLWARFQFAEIRSAIAIEFGQSIQPFAAERSAVLRAMPVREVQIAAAILDAGSLVEGGRMREALALIQPHAAYLEQRDLYDHLRRLRQIEGRALVRSGRPREGIVALRQALALAERLGVVNFAAEAHHQLAHAWEALGDWGQAARAADRFIETARQTLDPGARVICYYDAAAIHWKAGWHARADSLSHLMVAAIEEEQTQFAFAAEYFERVGDFGRAMSYLRRAALPDAAGHVPDQNFLYAGLTRMHLALGNADSALVSATAHDSIRWTFDETLVPRVLVAKGQHAAAVAAMRRWTDMQATRGNVRGQVKALASLSEMLADVAPTEALDVAREAESLAAKHGFLAERVIAMRVRGDAARRLGDATAIGILRQAAAVARAHPDAMAQIQVGTALAEAHAAFGSPARALTEYGRAIGKIEVAERTVPDDVTRARFRAARAQAFDGALRTVLAAVPPGSSPDSVVAWSSRKKSRASQRRGTPTLAAIRASLTRDEALIDYVVVDSAVWASVVTRSAATMHRLPLTPSQALALSKRVVAPVTAVFAGRVDLSRAPFDADAAHKLYLGLLAPLSVRLEGISHLVIVPDAPLHSVPFDALVTRRGPQPSYVLDDMTVRIALVPGPIRRYSLRGESMLLVVGDAPGAASERDDLRSQWKGRLEVLDGVRSSESNVRRDGPAHRVLHFATHARSSGRDPQTSYLALSRDSIDDGLLHYTEIEAMRAPYALVVLNACETSSGELLAGSGFLSLARAFLIGGASSVIATQWPVGASSATLSSRFYASLRTGSTLHVALRDAKLTLRNDPATAHPFFWASHVLLQGN